MDSSCRSAGLNRPHSRSPVDSLGAGNLNEREIANEKAEELKEKERNATQRQHQTNHTNNHSQHLLSPSAPLTTMPYGTSSASAAPSSTLTLNVVSPFVASHTLVLQDPSPSHVESHMDSRIGCDKGEWMNESPLQSPPHHLPHKSNLQTTRIIQPNSNFANSINPIAEVDSITNSPIDPIPPVRSFLRRSSPPLSPSPPSHQMKSPLAAIASDSSNHPPVRLKIGIDEATHLSKDGGDVLSFEARPLSPLPPLPPLSPPPMGGDSPDTHPSNYSSTQPASFLCACLRRRRHRSTVGSASSRGAQMTAAPSSPNVTDADADTDADRSPKNVDLTLLSSDETAPNSISRSCPSWLIHTFLGLPVFCWLLLLVCVGLSVAEIILTWSYSHAATNEMYQSRFDVACFNQMRMFAKGLTQLLESANTIARTLEQQTTGVETTQFIQDVLPYTLSSLGPPLFTSLTYVERLDDSNRSTFESSHGPISQWNSSTQQYDTNTSSDDSALWITRITVEGKESQPGRASYDVVNQPTRGLEIPQFADVASLPMLDTKIRQMTNELTTQLLTPIWVKDYSALSSTWESETKSNFPTTVGGYRLFTLTPVNRTSSLSSSFDAFILITYDLAPSIHSLIRDSTIRGDFTADHLSNMEDAYIPLIESYMASITAESENIRIFDAWQRSDSIQYEPFSSDLIESSTLSSSWPLTSYLPSSVPTLDWNFECRIIELTPLLSSLAQRLHQLRILPLALLISNVCVIIILLYLLARWYFAMKLERAKKDFSLKQVNQAVAAAELARDSKSDFMAFLCHELRNPLHAVLSMVDSLRDTELTADQFESVFTIHVSSELMLAITNDILDYSKIEAGRIQLENVPMDLYALIQSLVRANNSYAQERGIKVVGNIDPNVPRYIQADPIRLNQTITNLLSNAIKFSNKHSEVRIEVEVLNDDDELSSLPCTDPATDMLRADNTVKSVGGVTSMMFSDRLHDVSMRLLRSADPMSGYTSGARTPPSTRGRISTRGGGVHSGLNDEHEPRSKRRAHSLLHGGDDQYLPAQFWHNPHQHVIHMESDIVAPPRTSSPLTVNTIDTPHHGHRHAISPFSNESASGNNRKLSAATNVTTRTVRTLYPNPLDDVLNFTQSHAHATPQQGDKDKYPRVAHPNAVMTPLSTPAWSARALVQNPNLSNSGTTSLIVPGGASNTPIFGPSSSPDLTTHGLSLLRANSRRSTWQQRRKQSDTKRPSISFSHSRTTNALTSPVQKPNGPVKLVFKIIDHGVGIAPENVPALFEPYTQAKRTLTQANGGTGLGLAIVKRLCDLMNATIQVESEVDSGTTFSFAAEFQTVPPPSASIAHLMQQLPQQGTADYGTRYHNFTSLASTPLTINAPHIQSQPAVNSTQSYDDTASSDDGEIAPNEPARNNRLRARISNLVTDVPSNDSAIDPVQPFLPSLPSDFPQVVLTPAHARTQTTTFVKEETESQMRRSRSQSLSDGNRPVSSRSPVSNNKEFRTVVPDGTHLTIGPSDPAANSVVSSRGSTPHSSLITRHLIPPLQFDGSTSSPTPTSITAPGSASASSIQIANMLPSFNSHASGDSLSLSEPLPNSVQQPPLPRASTDQTGFVSPSILSVIRNGSASSDSGVRRLQVIHRASSRVPIDISSATIESPPRVERPSPSLGLPNRTTSDTVLSPSNASASSPCELSPSPTASTLNLSLPTTKKLNILCVDDAAINRRIMHKMLDSLYNLEDACDGLEALNKIKSNPTKYSCVLMDLMMPVMGGTDSLKEIRAFGLKHLPVIAVVSQRAYNDVTANTMNEDIEKCLSIGFTAFLSKPARKEVLRDKIAEVIQAEAERLAQMNEIGSPSEANNQPKP